MIQTTVVYLKNRRFFEVSIGGSRCIVPSFEIVLALRRNREYSNGSWKQSCLVMQDLCTQLSSLHVNFAQNEV